MITLSSANCCCVHSLVRDKSCSVFQADTEIVACNLKSWCLSQEEHAWLYSDECFMYSGHTSWSTSGLGYLTLWLVGHLRCFDGSGHPVRLVLAGLPLCFAGWIGITRLQVCRLCRTPNLQCPVSPGMWPTLYDYICRIQ